MVEPYERETLGVACVHVLRVRGACGLRMTLARHAATVESDTLYRYGGFLMAQLDSLDTLFEEELRDMYDAEKQLTKALPKLAKKASDQSLRQAFTQHLRQTKEHVDRLEQVFDLIERPARSRKCEGMKHLIAEGDDMIGDAGDAATRDALMIAAAQKVEHYEIAAYGTLRTWAGLLGKDDVVSLLDETLDEEKEADQKLTGLAEGYINEAAAARPGKMGWAAVGRAGRRRTASSRMGRQAAADRGRKRRR